MIQVNVGLSGCPELKKFGVYNIDFERESHVDVSSNEGLVSVAA